MKTPTDNPPETTPAPKKKREPEPLLLLPSWLFFSEKIDVEPGLSADALREQVALRVESFSPVPREQLLTGFRAAENGGSAICYAATRERCRQFLENLPAGTLHTIPAFALWEEENVHRAPLRIWFATDSELTALKFSPDSPLPESVVSWQIPAPKLPENATPEDAEREFSAMILAKRQEFQSELEGDEAEQKPGIYVIGEQVVSPKTQRGEIRLDRVDPDGKRVPAARTLSFSLAGEAIWLADIRDDSVLSQERRERKNRMILRNTAFALTAIALILLIAQIVLFGIRGDVEAHEQIVRDQAPKVKEIQSCAKLIEEISKVQKNRLQMMRSVAVMNAQRPDGVGFTSFGGNGTTGILSVAGSAESILLANEFEKNVRSCGFFQNVSFVANISASSANFSMQCTPAREKIAAVDFYDAGTNSTPATNDDNAGDGGDNNADPDATTNPDATTDPDDNNPTTNPIPTTNPDVTTNPGDNDAAPADGTFSKAPPTPAAPTTIPPATTNPEKREERKNA